MMVQSTDDGFLFRVHSIKIVLDEDAPLMDRLIVGATDPDGFEHTLPINEWCEALKEHDHDHWKRALSELQHLVHRLEASSLFGRPDRLSSASGFDMPCRDSFESAILKKLEEQDKLMKELSTGLREPTKDRKNAAAWRKMIPDFEEMIEGRCYATLQDARERGLSAVEWERCANELTKKRPGWLHTVYKHVRIVYVPGTNLDDTVIQTLSYENFSSRDPTILKHMISKIKRSGRLNVLKELQQNHPKTGDVWRDSFLLNLQKFIERSGEPIERESHSDGRPSDWFRAQERPTALGPAPAERAEGARRDILRGWSNAGRNEYAYEGWLTGPANSGLLSDAGFVDVKDAIDWCKNHESER